MVSPRDSRFQTNTSNERFGSRPPALPPDTAKNKGDSFRVTRKTCPRQSRLVAEQKPRGDAHIVVIARAIRVEREPVELDRAQRDVLGGRYVESTTEHHGKSTTRG